jgi:hypothetical protein
MLYQEQSGIPGWLCKINFSSHLRQDEGNARVDPFGLVAELADADQPQQIPPELVDLTKVVSGSNYS